MALCLKVMRPAVILAMLALASCQPSRTASSGACERPDMAFGGDVLLHQVIQQTAAGRADGFGPAFEGIAPLLARAEIAVVNLEGPAALNITPNGRAVADPGTRFDNRIYSGYPRFNYHPSIAPALAAAGVDVVQTANNHALDRGPAGVDLTLRALADAGLSTTGTVSRGDTGPWHVVRQVSGRSVAFVACTFSTNGLPDPRRQALLCYGNAPSVPSVIQQLSAHPDIDAVILLPHWGTEYSPLPNSRQRRLAQAAADAGATAIVGTHPHVLQPIQTLTARDGRRVPVAYSLGNLIASQWAMPRRTGAVLYLDLVRDDAGRIVASPPLYIPTRTGNFAGRGVAPFPAAQVPDGGISVAHASRILGPGLLQPNGCLSD